MARQDPKKTVSPKVGVASLGPAAAAIVWFFIIWSGVLPDDMSRAAINSATVGTGTILSFAFGYGIIDPLREEE